MDILIGVVGIVIGGLISWVISYYYYKKQIKEQINPLPHIKGVHEAVLELVGISIERQDAELQRGIKTLVLALLESSNNVLNAVGATRMLLGMIEDSRKLEDKEQMDLALKELDHLVPRFNTSLLQVSDEYRDLFKLAQEITGKDLSSMITQEEFMELLRKPKKNRVDNSQKLLEDQ
jgi:hypothetical protein